MSEPLRPPGFLALGQAPGSPVETPENGVYEASAAANTSLSFGLGAKGPEFSYMKEQGSFYYYGAFGSLMYITNEVAIVFDSEDFTLLKHGRPAAVFDWFCDCKKRYEAAGIRSSLHFVQATKWPVDQLNRILHCSGAVKKVLEELGLNTSE